MKQYLTTTGLSAIGGFILTALSAIGGYCFGGWSVMLDILLALIVLDYISGVIAAGAEGGTISSKVGFKRLPKKVLILLLVALGHQIDKMMGNGNEVMNAFCFFYAANELLSITENCGRAGVPVPDYLVKFIDVLKAKGGGNTKDDSK